jgi:zinc D-Ala-D-Ala carboxypeptidase
MVQLKHFLLSEFDSPDAPGSGSQMQEEFLKKLDLARTIASVPFKINSGFRTAAKNKAEGGKADSAHLTGWGADIDLPNSGGSRLRFVIVDALIRAGFNRIGIANGFIHVDADPTKDKNVIWLY